MASNESPIVVTSGPWTATWHGGRLMDISHLECEGAVHAIHAGRSWDWSKLGYKRAPTTKSIKAKLDEWIMNEGAEYTRNVVPYQR